MEDFEGILRTMVEEVRSAKEIEAKENKDVAAVDPQKVVEAAQRERDTVGNTPMADMEEDMVKMWNTKEFQKMIRDVQEEEKQKKKPDQE